MTGARVGLAVVLSAGLAATLTVVVRAATPPAAQERALTGGDLRTMRALAQYLDETAQGLLEGASDTVLSGAPHEARFLWSIRAFARSARDFRSALADYPQTPLRLGPRLAALAEVSQAVDERLRAAGALEQTRAEWDAVREVIDRMRLSLAGTVVVVPPAYVVPALSGAPLDQFRALAAALDESATRAHERAGQEMGSYQDRGAQFLGELHYFAAVSRDLHTRADAGAVSPQAVGATVDDLLKEAREADSRMRAANVFKEVWDDSSRTITILQQMVSLVRS